MDLSPRFARPIRPTAQYELATAAQRELRGEFPSAFDCLERAHVLAQSSTVQRVRVHWAMFRLVLRQSAASEVAIQAGRIARAALKTWFRALLGNTSGASVCGSRSMPIPSNRIFLITVASLTSTLLAACSTPPTNLDLSLQHPSREGRFMLRMDPPATGPAINQMHAWQVRLNAADGSPISNARIGFDGGMPQHGHGFPTKPRVTRELSPGVYALEGMKFSMTGWWDMRLDIRAGDAADTAVFNVIVDDTGIRR